MGMNINKLCNVLIQLIKVKLIKFLKVTNNDHR